MSGWDDKNRFPICGRERAFTQLHTCREFGAVFKVIGAGFAPAVKQPRPDNVAEIEEASVLGELSTVLCQLRMKDHERLD